MTGWQLFQLWEFEPSVVIGCVLLLAVYFWAIRFKLNGKALVFTLAVVILFLALSSPIDVLGDDYLFSAHMLQHMMLGTIAPPLLIAGLPTSMVQSLLRFPLVARIERILGYAPLALVVGTATFWIWHLPYLYNLALENETIHVIEHLLFIATGLMLWWPVLKPIPEGRLSPLAAIIYMGIAASVGTLLGIIFTVSDTPFYSFYDNPKDETGALHLIRDQWGLSQLDDQKLGGAIMWEPMGFIFLWVMMAAMKDWFKQAKDEAMLENQRRRENVGTD
jgi:cytochrome c oxidase assembly factor CtaG